MRTSPDNLRDVLRLQTESETCKEAQPLSALCATFKVILYGTASQWQDLISKVICSNAGFCILNELVPSDRSFDKPAHRVRGVKPDRNERLNQVLRADLRFKNTCILFIR